MSFLISYDRFYPLLNSHDENTIKNALQDIFELLADGNAIERSSRNLFMNDIRRFVNSNSLKVRKWAYHCAGIFQDEDICQRIIAGLAKETDRDNIMWALIGLSKTYDTELKLSQCVGKRHEEFLETISPQYLTDALVLFGGVVSINPKTVLLTNNMTDLEALTKIYAYDGLVHGLYPDITESVIQEIETHEVPRVREYAYWAQVLRRTRRTITDSKIDPDPGVQKWQVAQQIENGDEDFVVSALKPLARCPGTISLEVKSGVLRGLNNITYNENYVRYLCSWFSFEEIETIIIQLLNYFITNSVLNRKDGTFFDIIKDSLRDERLSGYIYRKICSDKNCGLEIAIENECFVLDYKDKGEKIVGNIQIGSGNVLNTGSENTFAVASNNSSAAVNTTGIESNELAKLIEEVRTQAKAELSAEEQEAVEGVLSTIEAETKSNQPRKPFIKTMLAGLGHIKGAVQFASALANLVKFFS